MKKIQARVPVSESDVIVVEAPAIIEATWHTYVHGRVMFSVFPYEEMVRRIVERNGLSKEQAEARIRSQISNREHIQHSNVSVRYGHMKRLTLREEGCQGA